MKIFDLIQAHNKDFAGTSPVLLAFLGDSVTHGCFEVYETGTGGIDCQYDYDNVYHARLRRKIAQLYPRATVNILDAGVSGDGTKGGLARIERDVLRFSPDFVCVSYGLNDACQGLSYLDTYAENLRKIFGILKEKGIETVFLSENMMASYVRHDVAPILVRIATDMHPVQTNGTLTKFFERAKQVCEECGVPYVDAYGKWMWMAEHGVDTTMLLSNAINHPTREMHQLFTDLLWEQIIK